MPNKIYRTAFVKRLTPGIMLGKGRGIEVTPLSKVLANVLLPEHYDDMTDELSFVDEPNMGEAFGNAVLQVNKTEFFLITPL